MALQLLDFWNNFINTVFRNIPDFVRYMIIMGLLILAFFFLSKTLNLKKDNDKAPINYIYLLFFILSFGLMLVYIWLR